MPNYTNDTQEQSFLREPVTIEGQDPPDDTTPDTGLKFFSQGFDTNYKIGVAYEQDAGIIDQAIASADENAETIFIRVHQPKWRKVISWIAQRTGGKPLMPDWETDDPNEVFLFARNINEAPGLTLEGLPMFVASGEYVYGLKKKPDQFKVARIPVDPADAEDYRVDLVNDFDQSLVDQD